jgi:multidrug efflux pump subunit AcrA (membrane-fusion protein)
MKYKTAYLLLLAPLALLPVVNGITRRGEAGPPPAAEPEPPTLRTARPERRTLTRIVEQPGHIEALEQTSLAVKIAGYIDRLNVDIGDHISKGQVLAELRIPELEQELKQKTAAAEQAQAELELSEKVLAAAEAAVARAEANVSLAEAGRTRAEAGFVRWRAELDRVTTILRSGAGDQQTVDQVTDQFRSAEAARGESVAAIRAAKAAHLEAQAQQARAAANVRVAAAKVAVAKADRDRVAANWDYRLIKAPYDGVVTQRLADTGAFLQPAGPAQVFVVVRTDPVRLFVGVPESEAARVREKMPVRVRVHAQEEREVTGEVARWSWAVEGQSRTLRVQVNLPNGDGRLRPGMYADARLAVEHPGVWAVPAAAVWTQDDQPTVLVVEDGKARRLAVKVGLRHGGFVQLLKKQASPTSPGESPEWVDLTGREEIVVESPAAVPDGQAVRVTAPASDG